MNNPEDALRGLNMLVCGSEEGLLAVSLIINLWHVRELKKGSGDGLRKWEVLN